jgi:hypothetical protein
MQSATMHTPVVCPRLNSEFCVRVRVRVRWCVCASCDKIEKDELQPTTEEGEREVRTLTSAIPSWRTRQVRACREK